MKKIKFVICLLLIIPFIMSIPFQVDASSSIDENNNVTLVGTITVPKSYMDGTCIVGGIRNVFKIDGYFIDEKGNKIQSDEANISTSYNYMLKENKTIPYTVTFKYNRNLIYKGRAEVNVVSFDKTMKYTCDTSKYTIGDKKIITGIQATNKIILLNSVDEKFYTEDLKYYMTNKECKNLNVGFYDIKFKCNVGHGIDLFMADINYYTENKYDSLEGVIPLEILPKLSLKATKNTITATRYGNCEYSIDNGKTWQDSNTFKGLKSNKKYKVSCRLKESAENESGTIVSNSIKTK